MTSVLRLLRKSVLLEQQSTLRLFNALKYPLLIALITFLAIQQWSFFKKPGELDLTYRNTVNIGTEHLYNFPLYFCNNAFPIPLAPTPDQTMSSCEQLTTELEKRGSSMYVYPNLYNRATIWLYYLDKWLYPDKSLNLHSMLPAFSLFYLIALSMLAFAFFFARLPLLGLLFVALCASNPFQLYEIYSHSNVFSLVLSMGLLALALMIMLLQLIKQNGRMGAIILISIVLGILFGLQYDLRTEAIGIFLGIIAVIALYPMLSWRHKIIILLFFLGSTLITNSLIKVHFDRKFDQANVLMKKYQGRQGVNETTSYNSPWWAIWSGLGDYDEKYGFLVDDRTSYSYYYGMVNPTERLETLLKRDVINTIAHDPLWFINIIGKRFNALLLENTPYRMSFGTHVFDIPASSHWITLLFVLPFLLLVLNRQYMLLAIGALILSIGVVAIAQLGRYGLEFYSVIHLFIFAFVVCWLVEVGMLIGGLRKEKEKIAL